MSFSNRSAVLCLGGGGARGLAHLGAVEALQSAGIVVERYVGVSSGSLAGALCAITPDISHVQGNVLRFLSSAQFQRRQAALFSTATPLEGPTVSGLFRWYGQIRQFLGARHQLLQFFRKPALMPGVLMQELIAELLPDIDITDTQIPLSVVALDLLSGRRVVLERGRLRTALLGSTAIPGVFPPVAMDGMLLCDVGVVDAIPTRVGRAHARDLTVAVDVGGELRRTSHCRTAADVFLRISNVSEHLFRDYSRDLADLVIQPDVAETPWFDCTDARGLIDAGRAAAVLALCSADLNRVSAGRRIPEFPDAGLRTPVVACPEI